MAILEVVNHVHGAVEDEQEDRHHHLDGHPDHPRPDEGRPFLKKIKSYKLTLADSHGLEIKNGIVSH